MEYFKREGKIENINLAENLEKLINTQYQETRGNKDGIIRLHETTLAKEELIAFIRCYLNGNITMGEANKEYETIAQDYFGSKYCLSNNSGSSANLLAISGLIQTNKLKSGDKVIVPALSWSTTVFPLIQHGLIPVFVDQENSSFNIDPDQIKKCSKEIEGIKAIMLIHTYGVPADMEAIMNIADENDWIIIEDTCESMGATYDNKKVGSFGTVGTFSTYYSHHICTLEGGLTVTSSHELSEVMQSIRSHGWIRHMEKKEEIALEAGKEDANFLFSYSGYNLRLSEPQAAMGIQQLRKLDKFIGLRRKNAEHFITLVDAGVSEAVKMPTVADRKQSSWFGMPLVIKQCSRQRLRLIKQIFKKRGIETRPFLAGNFANQPVMEKYKHIKFGSLGVAASLDETSLAIPCHQSLEISDMEKISETLISALRESR